jgi:hypothetical protein
VFGKECKRVGGKFSEVMINEIASIRLDPAIALTMESVGFHEEGGGGGNGDDSRQFLSKGGEVIGFTVKGSGERCVSGVGLGV